MTARALDGRVAIVTGASRGIGAAIARRLAVDGAAVVVNYRSRSDAAHEVVRGIVAGGGRAMAKRADVTDCARAAELIDAALQSFGRLDVLVNNAGAAVMGDALSMAASDVDEAMRLTVNAPLVCSQLAAAHLDRYGCGRIVNIGSVGGLGTAIGGLAPYAIAKAALNMLTKRLAFELGSRGITVNSICPGLVDTDMQHDTAGNAGLAALRTDPARFNMLGRVGRPEDIAGAVAFVASDDAAFMTGQALTIDGGGLAFLSRSA